MNTPEMDEPDAIERLYIESPAIGLVEFRKRIESLITSEKEAAARDEVETIWIRCFRLAELHKRQDENGRVSVDDVQELIVKPFLDYKLTLTQPHKEQE